MKNRVIIYVIVIFIFLGGAILLPSFFKNPDRIIDDPGSEELETEELETEIPEIVEPEVVQYIPHEPISISDDTQLKEISSSGIGTPDDPFIIEGWEIVTRLLSLDIIGKLPCIQISFTTKYFIIRNCYVSTVDQPQNGIYIYKVANGTATIVNNICGGSGNIENGIYVANSDYPVIENNTSNENHVGIYIDNCFSATVFNNTCIDSLNHGIILDNCYSSLISNNFCENNWYGINIEHCDSSNISSNFCISNSMGVNIESSPFIYVAHNFFYNNHYNGIDISVCASSIITNNECSGNDGIFLSGSASSRITNNIFSNNYEGMGFSYSPSLIITNNTVTNCSDIGCTVYHCYSSSICNNSFIGVGLEINVFKWETKELYLSYTILNNTVNGLPLGYLKNVINQTIKGPYGQLLLVNCNNTIIEKQNLSYTTIGISLYFCCGCEVSDTFCNNNGESGIFLYRTLSTSIKNITCINSGYYSISSLYSSYINITNCICKGSTKGLVIGYCDNFFIINNTFTENRLDGLLIHRSVSIMILDNVCKNNNGILLQKSTSSNVYANSFIDSGLFFYMESKEGYLSNNVLNNTVNGLPLGYFENLTDESITTEFGQLILVNCNNTLIYNYTTSIGVDLYYCNNCTIEDKFFIYLEGIYQIGNIMGSIFNNDGEIKYKNITD